MNELALFAGAGGGILGGHLLGWRTVCAVEWDAYAASVLVQRQNDGCFPAPGFPIWDDVQTFDGRPWRGRVDVISGGFPCQDISTAGKGGGLKGTRSSLWGQFKRLICEVKPLWVFVENVPNLTACPGRDGNRGLGTVLADLASLGFNARWGVLGARHTGAPHKRDRIWIVAHSHGERTQDGNSSKWTDNAVGANSCGEKRLPDPSAIQGENGWECVQCGEPIFGGCRHSHGEWKCGDCGEWTYPFHYDHADGCQSCGSTNVSNPYVQRLEGWPRHELGEQEPRRDNQETGRPTPQKAIQSGTPWWTTVPGLGGVGHAVADRLDGNVPSPGPRIPCVGVGIPSRSDRLKCLGNGQVPQCAALAWKILSKDI